MESKRDLIAALVKAQAEFKAVKKSCENKFAGFRYPSYSDMAAATYPALNKHGVFVHYEQEDDDLTGYLLHADTGQSLDSTAPLLYPLDRKTGQPQRDGQGLEIALAYAKKILVMELTGAWLEGSEPEVEQDQGKKNAEAAVAEEPKKRKGKPALIDQIRTALLLVKASPVALKEKLAKAEQYAIEGRITEEELIELQKEFTIDDNTPGDQ